MRHRRISSCTFFATLFGALFAGSVQAHSPMSFSNPCSGNSSASCVVAAVGDITADTPAQFRAYLQSGVEGNRVLLDSAGGDPVAGMALGRMLREHALETEVGRWRSDGGIGGEVVAGAECARACALAFMGGIRRQADAGNVVGLDTGLLAYRWMSPARIVTYMTEMGVDPRFLFLEPDRMDIPPADILQEYGLTTQDGFGPFMIAPHDSVIMATSHRLGPARLYDGMTALSARCHEDAPALIVEAEGELGAASYSGFVTVNAQDETRIAPEQITTDGETTVVLKLSRDLAEQVTAADHFKVTIIRGQVSGGDIVGHFDLSETDARMITSAFRYCRS